MSSNVIDTSWNTHWVECGEGWRDLPLTQRSMHRNTKVNRTNATGEA
jgi:hypothetical protein